MAQQARILMVNCQFEGLREAAESLREAGYEVLYADMEQAVCETVQKLLPAVVLLRIVPSDLQAAEISHEIRSSPKLMGVKVVHICMPTTSLLASAEIPEC